MKSAVKKEAKDVKKAEAVAKIEQKEDKNSKPLKDEEMKAEVDTPEKQVTTNAAAD